MGPAAGRAHRPYCPPPTPQKRRNDTAPSVAPTSQKHNPNRRPPMSAPPSCCSMLAHPRPLAIESPPLPHLPRIDCPRRSRHAATTGGAPGLAAPTVLTARPRPTPPPLPSSGRTQPSSPTNSHRRHRQCGAPHPSHPNPSHHIPAEPQPRPTMATASEEYPVKTPTSMARRAPVNSTSRAIS